MDVQEAVSESTPMGAAEEQVESKRDGLRRFTMGPNDSLEGKLTYEGHVHVDGRAEGEFRVTGNIEVRREDGTIESLPRATLCRCGFSNHKPFCDNQHLAMEFRAPGLPFKIHISPVRPRLAEPISKSDDPRRLS